jgi:hydrophobe/amphiphile efflux-3 (HAE3) family protein
MNRLIRLATDYPIWTLAVVIVASLAFLIPLSHLKQETDFREFISDDDPIIRLMDEAEARYGRTMGIMVLIRNESGVLNPTTLAKMERMTEAFERIPGVKSVTTPLNAQVITGTETSLNVQSAAPNGEAPATDEALATMRERIEGSRMLEGNVISSDGKASSINIELEVGADEYVITPQIVELVESFEGDGDELFLYGDAYFDALMSQEMETDLTVLFPLAILLMVVVLFLSFMNLRGVLIPIGIVILSVFVAMGSMTLFGFPMTMVSFIAPVLLLAIGIADGIHVLNRYNEEATKGLPKRQAILNTMAEMKGPVVMTSLTTAVGFLSLLSSFFLPQKQFGVVTALGVLAAMVFSLAMIPAVLSLLKTPKVRTTEKGLRPMTRVLLAFERVVDRRHRWVLIGAVLLIAAMVAALPSLRIETSNEEFLGRDHPAIQILTFIDEHFSGGMQVMVEIDTERRDGLKDPEVLNRMVALEEFLRANGINRTISLTDLVREMNQKFHSDDPGYYAIPDDRALVAQLMLLFTFQGGSLGDMALGDFSAGTIMGFYPMESSGDISALSKTVQTYLDENFPVGGAVNARMVGATILMDRMFSRMNQSQMIGLGTTVVAVTILVSVLMGSVIAGLIASIPLILTVTFSMGLMAYTGQPLDMMTLMVSAIAVGIGVDYSIHFISRFRNEYRANRDAQQALQATIRTTGRGITYNALTVALGFFILVFASFKGIRMFGLQIALTMVVSAVSAISIIPAILVEWQPKFLSRLPWKRN